MTYLPVYELTRGGIVESIHFGAVAAADKHGRLVASFGDPRTVTFLRSTAKPFQTLPLLESGAAEHFGFTPREIALTCASHRGLDLHVEAVQALQAKIGVSEADLLCGTHPPEDPEVALRFQRTDIAPTPCRHNCSGKHTGMLAQAKQRGLPLADYIGLQHPVQRTILQTFAEMCGLEVAQVVVGIDGCSAPNFAVPLLNAATAFARLADPDELGVPAPRQAALRGVFAAVTAHPEMIRGPGSFDTELMRTRPGLILAKGGAEGYQGLALRQGALGPASPALGVALKISDGSARSAPAGAAELHHSARGPVALEVLRQLGALGEAELAVMAGFGYSPRRTLTNWRGVAVGEARPCFELVRSP